MAELTRVPMLTNGDLPAGELTKREWLAGMALAGMSSMPGAYAGLAVGFADAVLEALAGKPEPHPDSLTEEDLPGLTEAFGKAEGAAYKEPLFGTNDFGDLLARAKEDEEDQEIVRREAEESREAQS